MLLSLSALVVAGMLCVPPQCAATKDCSCQLNNAAPNFPYARLEAVRSTADGCTADLPPKQVSEVDNLLVGLDGRVKQLLKDVELLEKEDNGNLYGAVSLRIIENELADIKRLFNRLNSTSLRHRTTSAVKAKELLKMQSEMKELEKFDTSSVVKKQRENVRLRRDLEECKQRVPTPPPPPKQRLCQLMKVTGPQIKTNTSYGKTYSYGAWGHDPKPVGGKADWFWLVVLTSSNAYANYVRQYDSLDSLMKHAEGVDAQISTSNPTTNTIQGSNVVMYDGALYYNCYNSKSICRFDLASESVTSVALPHGTEFNSKANFANDKVSYPYSDFDLSTDENGIWVVYASADSLKELVISEVIEGSPPSLGRTWRTNLPKAKASNTFMACGVMYATQHVDSTTEVVFYSYDTKTKQKRSDLGITIRKTSPDIQSLNYNPVDRLLYVYSDSDLLTYKTEFQ